MALILSVFMLFSVPNSVYAYDTGNYITCYESMNTRSGPGLNYATRGTLKKNVTVNVVKISGNWGQMSDGRWIRLDGGYVKKVSSSSTGTSSSYKTGVYKVRYNGTNLRSGAGLNYSVVATVNSGTMLSVTSVSGEWGKTTYNNKSCWIRLNGYATYVSALSGTTTSQASAMITKAANHVGYKNTNYKKTGTPFGEWYAKKVNNSSMKTAPWCAMFVCYVADEAGVSTSQIPLFSSCGDGIGKFKNMGCWKAKSGYTPKTGDLIFFQWTANGTVNRHVGIVESVSNGKVYTIEGNTSSSVARRSYDLNYGRILGYAAPKYK